MVYGKVPLFLGGAQPPWPSKVAQAILCVVFCFAYCVWRGALQISLCFLPFLHILLLLELLQWICWPVLHWADFGCVLDFLDCPENWQLYTKSLLRD